MSRTRCLVCNKKISPDVKTCPKCGATTNVKDGSVSNTNGTIDKIYKKQTFTYDKGFSIFNKEEGELFLYQNRVEFEGGGYTLEFLMSDIVDVSVSDQLGKGYLIISDTEGDYKFYLTNKNTFMLAVFVDVGVAAMGDKKMSDLEAWRIAIDNFRFSDNTKIKEPSDALSILKIRLANGEISIDEFRELKNEIN